MTNTERTTLEAAAKNKALRVQYGHKHFTLFNDGPEERVYVTCDYTKRTDEIRALESVAREYVSCG